MKADPMRKLRQVQERRSHQDVENDLRNLGDTELIKDLPPQPFLVAESSFTRVDLNILRRIESVTVGTTAGHDFLTSHNPRYKPATLDLFFAGLLLFQSSEGKRLFLGDFQPLRQYLLHSFRSSAPLPTIAEFIENGLKSQNISFTTALTVSEFCQYTLRDAGIIREAQEIPLLLEDSQIRQITNDLAQGQKQKFDETGR
jgi:hypothetical protein